MFLLNIFVLFSLLFAFPPFSQREFPPSHDVPTDAAKWQCSLLQNTFSWAKLGLCVFKAADSGFQESMSFFLVWVADFLPAEESGAAGTGSPGSPVMVALWHTACTLMCTEIRKPCTLTAWFPPLFYPDDDNYSSSDWT